MLKLNRKGYMAVEIVLASVVSITIAVFNRYNSKIG